MKILKIRKKILKNSKIDKIREECGIFGISNHQDASALVALGLHALQHRGEEGCGFVSFDGKNYHSEKRQGLVGDHFTDHEVLKKLPELPQMMEKANQALTFLASGQIPQNSNSYSAMKNKELEMKSFRNQSIIGLLLLVFIGFIVF